MVVSFRSAPFQDWLWRDGAEGFEVTLDESFTEGIESAFDDIDAQRKALAALRVQAATALNDEAVRMSSAALDAAGARDEFQIPLDSLVRAMKQKAINISKEDLEGLRLDAEDPHFWAFAEVQLALTHKSLQMSLPASRLARRIVTLMSRSVDLKILNLISTLGQQPDLYAKSLLEALEKEALGERIAQGIAINKQTLEGLHALLAPRALKSTSLELLKGLLERAVTEEPVLEGMSQLAAMMGLDAFWSKVDITTLSMEAMNGVGKILVAHDAPLKFMVKLIDIATPPIALSIILSAPTAILTSLSTQIRKILMSPKAGPRLPLLELLLQQDDAKWRRLIGEALLESKGEAWGEGSLRLVGLELAKRRLGNTYLVPLVRSNAVSSQVRLIMLRALFRTSDALEEAVKWNMSELLAPPAVKVALKKARQRLKG